MAVTKIRQIKQTVNKAINYILKENKTENFLVSSYNCNVETAYIDFEITETMARKVVGDNSKVGGSNILAYHLIQSFSPNDSEIITAKEAHEIGKQTADELLQGKHEYVITTHIDRKHTHNHIIFNARSFYDLRKFNSIPWKTVAQIRGISDKICLEHGLDIIKNPSLGKGKSYHEWQQRKKGTSWKAQIENIINQTIFRVNDYKSFCKELGKQGVEIRNAYEMQGKHISFRLPGQQRYTRGKTIGEEYTRKNIIKRIAEPEKIKGLKEKVAFPTYDKKIEWQARKIMIEDTKKLANVLKIIRSENINEYMDFAVKIDNLTQKHNKINSMIMELDQKNIEYKNVTRYLITYNDQLPIYQKLGKVFKKGIEEKYKSELEAFSHAAKKLKEMNVNVNVDVSKVIALSVQQEEKIKELKGEGDKLAKKIGKIKEAQETVKQIHGNRDKVKETEKEKEYNHEL